MPESGALVPQDEKPLMPVASTPDLVDAMKRFEAVKVALLVKDLDTYTVHGIERIRKSGWRKLALAFNLSDEVLESSYLANEAAPGSWTYRIRVRVTSKGGRSVQGVGAASTTERTFANPVHDCYALAHTRAKSRAIADMLGSSDLVAEEVEEPEQPTPKATTPTPTSTNTPKALANRRPQDGRSDAFWDFLDEILGPEISEHVTAEPSGDEVLVRLDKSDGDRFGNAFLSRMMRWGFIVRETPAGMLSMMKRPKGPSSS